MFYITLKITEDTVPLGNQLRLYHAYSNHDSWRYNSSFYIFKTFILGEILSFLFPVFNKELHSSENVEWTITTKREFFEIPPFKDHRLLSNDANITPILEPFKISKKTIQNKISRKNLLLND